MITIFVLLVLSLILLVFLQLLSVAFVSSIDLHSLNSFLGFLFRRLLSWRFWLLFRLLLLLPCLVADAATHGVEQRFIVILAELGPKHLR